MKKELIVNHHKIKEIILNAKNCVISMVDNGIPYCIPMNFGYENEIFYFHGALYGKKYNILKTNPNVCLTLYTNTALNIRHAEVACSYSLKFKSVVAIGKVEFVENNEEKAKFLNIIMKNYTNRDDFQYSMPSLEGVSVFFLKPTELTAYKRGY